MLRRFAQGCVVLAVASTSATAAELEDFFGAYVGVAVVEDVRWDKTEQRDMEIVIDGYLQHGFRVRWVNVTLVDGRRDVPGVERRVQTVLFAPSDDHDYFVEVPPESPFKERDQMRPVLGDALRWAALLDDTLRVTTFQVLEDGRYEMQIYDRTLTEIGLDVRFERIVDDRVVRSIEGRTARANGGGAED